MKEQLREHARESKEQAAVEPAAPFMDASAAKNAAKDGALVAASRVHGEGEVSALRQQIRAARIEYCRNLYAAAEAAAGPTIYGHPGDVPLSLLAGTTEVLEQLAAHHERVKAAIAQLPAAAQSQLAPDLARLEDDIRDLLSIGSDNEHGLETTRAVLRRLEAELPEATHAARPKQLGGQLESIRKDYEAVRVEAYHGVRAALDGATAAVKQIRDAVDVGNEELALLDGSAKVMQRLVDHHKRLKARVAALPEADRAQLAEAQARLDQDLDDVLAIGLDGSGERAARTLLIRLERELPGVAQADHGKPPAKQVAAGAGGHDERVATFKRRFRAARVDACRELGVAIEAAGAPTIYGQPGDVGLALGAGLNRVMEQFTGRVKELRAAVDQLPANERDELAVDQTHVNDDIRDLLELTFDDHGLAASRVLLSRLETELPEAKRPIATRPLGGRLEPIRQAYEAARVEEYHGLCAALDAAKLAVKQIRDAVDVGNEDLALLDGSAKVMERLADHHKRLKAQVAALPEADRAQLAEEQARLDRDLDEVLAIGLDDGGGLATRALVIRLERELPNLHHGHAAKP